MATYVTSKCPHCGKMLRVMRPKGEYAYGSPLQTCVHCKKPYIDSYFKEPIIEGAKPEDVKTFSIGMMVFALLSKYSVIFGIWLSINNNSSGTWFIIIGLVLLTTFICLIISDVKDYDKRLQTQIQQIQESEKRLSNFEYAATLQKLGYAIPYKYSPSYWVRRGLTLGEYLSKEYSIIETYAKRAQISHEEYIDFLKTKIDSEHLRAMEGEKNRPIENQLISYFANQNNLSYDEYLSFLENDLGGKLCPP